MALGTSPSPLHQFEVTPILPAHLLGLDVTITNQTLWTGIGVSMVILLMLLGIRRMQLVPGRMQAMVEMTFEFVQGLTRDTAGKEALAFLPLILTTFLFVACLNLIGMVPHSFTVTSQITTTAYMAGMVFAMVLGVGFYKQGFHFLSMFIPKGAPVLMWPIIIPIELISFLARPVTLAVRLCANMVAGHILLKIFATFCVMLAGLDALNGIAGVSAVVPLLVLTAISALEVFVALLQAYIFTVLTCVYLNDALHGH